MKNLSIVILFSASLLFGFTYDRSLNQHNPQDKSVEEEEIKFFEGSWQEALKKADEEDKLIFLDAMASWCGFCKILERDTFSNIKVVEFFNRKFINFKMDMEKNPNGPRLSKKYNLKGYPTLYFIDKNEVLIHSGSGNMSARDIIRLGQEALDK
ncbi:DUF255 domain-containing protein [Paracrocinitomix mangrovi]|uniref:thioredoxin family protein n=1 Tax=Paracrocinitomix mangrovi TaxID=2862509 RepID=UPI001C8DD5B6|nr:DUF255 domain-containing protein [Paracrocinitomix mangrovi]UKN01278.1 DUF255 domain-containing protein [Paracrocinitomix mangrovi]